MAPQALSSAFVGRLNRFRVVELLTRFGAVSWLAQDMDIEDAHTGLPEVVVQADSLEGCLERLAVYAVKAGH